MDNDHWFADVTTPEDETHNPGWPWQAFLQTAGCCLPLQTWFRTEAECEAFIRTIPSGLQER